MDIFKCKQEIEYWKREIEIKKHIIEAILHMNTREYFDNNIDNETEVHDEYYLYGIGLEFNADLVEEVRRSDLKQRLQALEKDEHLLRWYTGELITLLENQITGFQIEKELENEFR